MPPAELEGLLITHPDIADAGVVGVVVNGLELPRAYIVLKKKPTDIAAQDLIAKEIQEWVKLRVGKPKQLRGGVVIISEVPKRSIICASALPCELKLMFGRFLVLLGRSSGGCSENAL